MDRVKNPESLFVPALSIGIIGGIQPDRLATLVLAGDDDGLAARILYVWPERVPPRRPTRSPPSGAKARLEKLFALEERWDPDGGRVCLPFEPAGAAALQSWREQVAAAEPGTSGLFLSWLGKLPGMALRVATILEHLYWVGDREHSTRPATISERAVVAAIAFLDEYGVPMARRCFGEASLPQADRDAISLARWMAALTQLPDVVNARDLRKAAVLPTKEAGRYDAALEELSEAGWVWPMPARAGGSAGRKRKDWAINPRLKAALS